MKSDFTSLTDEVIPTVYLPRMMDGNRFSIFTQAGNRFISNQRFSKHGDFFHYLLFRTYVL